MPAHRLGDQASGDEADGRARRGDEAEDAKCLRAVKRLGKEHHDHGQDHSRADRAADALHESRRDQHGLVEGQATQQRGADENRETRQVDPLAPDQVTDPAGEQEQAAECDQVRVDYPRQAGLREGQVLLNRRQRDVDDRHVDDDQEESGAQNYQ